MNLIPPSDQSFEPASRLRGIDVSPILRVGAEVEARRRQGQGILSLCAGEPDFETPEFVREAAVCALKNGQTRYTPLNGSNALLDAIIASCRRRDGRVVSRDEIICAAGVKQVLHNALMATINQGDEVVIPVPCWTSYFDMVRLCGGRVVPLATEAEDGFRVRADRLESAIGPRTRWLLLNSPNNPTGAVLDDADVSALAAVLRRHPRVLIACDDIYREIIFDGRRFASFLASAPDLAGRVLIADGVSKSHAMTGWRLGWGIGSKALVAAMASVQSQTTSCANAIAQAATVAALSEPDTATDQRRLVYQERRDRVLASVKRAPGLTAFRPQGSFFCLIDCRSLLGREDDRGRMLGNDMDVCRALLDAGVAVAPGSAFAAPGTFRISFAASDDVIDLACEHLVAFASRISSNCPPHHQEL